MNSNQATGGPRPEPPRENEEVLDHYLLDAEDLVEQPIGSFDERKRFRGPPPYSSMGWDKIDPELAARLRYGRVLAWATARDVRWASCLEQLKPDFEPIWHNPRPSALSNVRVASWLSIERLSELRGTIFHEHDLKGTGWNVKCGITGVQKVPKDVLRVIFDARQANELTVPRKEKLILFSLEDIILSVSRYPHVTTVDYRHFFYQIPLPQRLAWLFVVNAGPERFWPRVLPMGWREAVCIAQVTTWMTALHHTGKERNLERDYGIGQEDLETLLRLPDMPAYVPLRRDGREVGRIFVLLDGVMVACADPEMRDRWAHRLRTNEDHFHVVRKECLNADLNVQGQVAEFAGVVFTHEGWSPRANLTVGPATAHDTNARRVASRLGSLLWAIRVHSAHDPARRGLLQYPGLLQLYSRLGVARAWDRATTLHVTDSEAALLAAHERALKARTCTPWSDIAPRPEGAAVALLATDAYPWGMGLVLYSATGEVLWTKHQELPETHQVVAEATAVPWALQQVGDYLAARGAARPRAFVVAVDADTVRTAFNKGYARSEELRSALRDAVALSDWLYLVRVPGEHNGADAPSRDKPLEHGPLRTTWDILSQYMRTFQPAPS